MAKVVLVNPPFTAWDSDMPLPKTLENTTPSFGLCCLAAVLRERGHEPKIVEAGALQLSLKETLSYILREGPDAVGFRASTVSFKNASLLARAVKEHSSRISVIIGGPHVTAVPVETLSRFPQFDYGVIGEGELTLTELLEALSGKASKDALRPGDINGIAYRAGGEVILSPKRAYIKDLDTLPMPAWDLLVDFPHRYQPPLMSYKALPVASMVTSRGCPFQCTFCDRSVFGNLYRSYSAGYISGMIEHLAIRYGVKHLNFYDDLFAASSKRLSAVCGRLMEKNINVSWSCDARVNTVTPESLALMKKAGCWEIAYGIESGSQKILDLVAKGITLEEIERGVRWTHEAGIKVKGLFMMGHPMETRDTIRATVALARRLPFDHINISKFTPFPGTEIFRDAHRYGALDPDWDKMNAMTFVFVPRGFTQKELDWEYKKALAKFYWRPGKTVELLVALLGDRAGLKRIVRAQYDFLAYGISRIFGIKPQKV